MRFTLRNKRAELTNDAIGYANICCPTCPATATTLILAGITVLNLVTNAAILGFVLSAVNYDLYISSHTTYVLAIEGQARRRPVERNYPLSSR